MTKFNINYTANTPECLAGVVKLNDKTVINFNFTKNIDSFNLVTFEISLLRNQWDQITNYLKNVSHHHFRRDYLWVD